MLLLGEGASIDQDNNTLLNCVARGGYIDTVKLLLRKGAPIEAIKKDDSTPFHLATQNGHTRVVEVLLGKGTPMEALNLEGILHPILPYRMVIPVQWRYFPKKVPQLKLSIHRIL